MLYEQINGVREGRCIAVSSRGKLRGRIEPRYGSVVGSEVRYAAGAPNAVTDRAALVKDFSSLYRVAMNRDGKAISGQIDFRLPNHQ